MSGEPAPRHEAALKVTGRAVYEGETPVPGMLHATLVIAPIGCGEIRSVNGEAARLIPGYIDLVSYEHAAALKPSGATAMIRHPTIHFPGQPVALICAETLRAAQAAAGAVRVDARAAPAVTGMDQAEDQALRRNWWAATRRKPAAATPAKPWPRLILSSAIAMTPPSTTTTPLSLTRWFAGGRARPSPSTPTLKVCSEPGGSSRMPSVWRLKGSE